MAESNRPRTTCFDPRGDVKLLLDGPEGEEVFIVSSKAMTLVSDPWRAMLDPKGSFSESQSQGNHCSREIPLHDDNPKPLSILLHIAHLQFDKVPLNLEFEELLALAILTDKYQATKVVTPWLPNWIKHLEHLVDKPGYEEWLWIAWEFGLTNVFERVARRLVLGLGLNEDKECLTSTYKIVAESLPPDIFGTKRQSVRFLSGASKLTELPLAESVLDVRRATIHGLLDNTYHYVDNFLSESDPEAQCQNITNKRECDALAFGSLVLGLRSLKLWPKKKASEIASSVEEIAQGLSQIEIFTYPRVDRFRSDSDHNGCNFQKQLQSSTEIILGTLPSALKSSHSRHLDIQCKKCQLRDYNS